MTQKEIAEQLNVSQQSVSKWFSGKSLPRGSHLLALSKLLYQAPETLLKELEKNATRKS